MERGGNVILYFTLWNASHKDVFLKIGPGTLVRYTGVRVGDDGRQFAVARPSQSVTLSVGPTLLLQLAGHGVRSQFSQYDFTYELKCPENITNDVVVGLHFDIGTLVKDDVVWQSLERSLVMHVKKGSAQMSPAAGPEIEQ